MLLVFDNVCGVIKTLGGHWYWHVAARSSLGHWGLSLWMEALC